MYFLTMWNARSFVLLFRVFGIRSYRSIAFRILIECVRYLRHSFAVKGHSTASLATFLSIMDETGNDLPLLDVNPGQSSQETALSGEDSKLDNKFSEFKRGLEQKELVNDSQI